MVNVRIALLVIILYLGAVLLFAVNAINNHEIGNLDSHNSSLINNTTFNNSSIENSSIENSSIENITAVLEKSIWDNPTLPSQEYVLHNINWSNYSLLQNPYFHNFEVSDPTFVVDHKFLYVVIVVEINDAKNKTEIFNQLSGVVLEERKLLGPNSAPTIWGTVNGVMVYYAALLPYETRMHNSYLP